MSHTQLTPALFPFPGRAALKHNITTREFFLFFTRHFSNCSILYCNYLAARAACLDLCLTLTSDLEVSVIEQGVSRTLKILKLNHLTLKTLKTMQCLTKTFKKEMYFRIISFVLIEIYEHVFLSQKTQILILRLCKKCNRIKKLEN